MKKFLLPACLMVAAAFSANAEDDVTIVWQDDFSWTKPFATEYNLGDPVGTNDSEAKGISMADANCTVDGKTAFVTAFDASIAIGGPNPGYLTRIWPGSGFYDSFLVHDGYIRIGSSGSTGGLRTPDQEWVKEVGPDWTELWLEFDWCPVRNADGTYQPTELMCEYRPSNIIGQQTITHNLKDGEPMAWQHVKIDVFEDAIGIDFSKGSAGKWCNVIIQNVDSQHGGDYGWYIDNIWFATAQKPVTGAVTDIVVEDDTNAPVEYFNLQGVRVANPEAGLYIKRQGKKVSKFIAR